MGLWDELVKSEIERVGRTRVGSVVLEVGRSSVGTVVLEIEIVGSVRVETVIELNWLVANVQVGIGLALVAVLRL